MDNNFYSLVFVPFFLAFLITAVITPVVIYFTKKYGLMDDPKRKHPAILHKKPLPRGGGIALFFGAFFASIYLLPWNNTTGAIFLAAFIALTIGVIDDILNAQSKDVSPYFRLLINVLCAIIIVGSGITLDFITHPLGGILYFDRVIIPVLFGQSILLSQVVTVLWIIWVMNMLNWSKGVDGVMPGMIVIAGIIIGILSLRFPIIDPNVAIDVKLSFIIAGTALGFLLFNFYPAKIFPGYGATSIYLLLAVVSILSSAKLATAILVLGIPTADALFTFLRRLLTFRSPFHGDKKHLYHLLLQVGWSQRQIALFYWLISAIVGGVALQLQSRNKLFALIMLLVIIGGSLFFLHLFMRHKHENNNA